MKKTMAMVILAFCLLLSGCSGIPDAYGGPPLGTSAQNAGMNESERTVSIYDYNEYIDYIKQIQWPFGFAEWSDIAYLGTWTGFGLASYDYTRYWYMFNNGSHDMIIYIDHTEGDDIHESTEAWPIVTISGEMTSMCFYPCVVESVITRNGVEYFYDRTGILETIVWHSNGVEYRLGGKLSQYPIDNNNSFVSRLLSLNDADLKLALAEIKPDLETK